MRSMGGIAPQVRTALKPCLRRRNIHSHIFRKTNRNNPKLKNLPIWKTKMHNLNAQLKCENKRNTKMQNINAKQKCKAIVKAEERQELQAA